MTDSRTTTRRAQSVDLAYWTPVGPPLRADGHWRQRARIFLTVVPPADESRFTRDWLALRSDVPAAARPGWRSRPARPLVFWRLVRGNTPLALGVDVTADVRAARARVMEVKSRAADLLVAPLFDDGANTGWYATDGDRAVLRGLPGVQLRPTRAGEISLSDALAEATLERYVHHVGVDSVDEPPQSRRPAVPPSVPALLGRHPGVRAPGASGDSGGSRGVNS